MRLNWLKCVRRFVKRAEKNVRNMIMIIVKNVQMLALTVLKSVKNRLNINSGDNRIVSTVLYCANTCQWSSPVGMKITYFVICPLSTISSQLSPLSVVL